MKYGLDKEQMDRIREIGLNQWMKERLEEMPETVEYPPTHTGTGLTHCHQCGNKFIVALRTNKVFLNTEEEKDFVTFLEDIIPRKLSAGLPLLVRDHEIDVWCPACTNYGDTKPLLKRLNHQAVRLFEAMETLREVERANIPLGEDLSFRVHRTIQVLREEAYDKDAKK